MTYFVEYEIDQPGPPVSYHVTATEEQAAEIQAFLNQHCEQWQEPWVAPVVAIPFEELMHNLREVMDPEYEDEEERATLAALDHIMGQSEEDDAPAADPGTTRD